ncbi:diacylglycerol kinase family protein [Paenibacillus sp. OV219]|uniref:diacylglycerol kinase family protein n=1 Tax=Paenibacillus sp. OV219 TaxID=1884377 RepID=UPI0008CB8C66|nr:diacylglycerol kinase family protein [Paenibacillus sp. OV219]SEN09681.1 undecaprenol kinase [Paenibacillus sp. OV219]
MRRLLRSFSFAFAGIGAGIRTQANMRIHVAAAIIVNVAGVIAHLERIEWLVIILMQAAVMAAELVNTAIEHVVDLASPEQQPLAKAAKDTAAGAVLILAIAAVIIGLIVFVPHIWP